MAQYQITLDSEILHQLFLKDSKDDGVAKLLESVLNQILKAQVSEQLAAEPYERTEERKGYRNGFYPHQLTTRVGTITLRVPRIRGGKFSTELFARYQRSEQALVLGVATEVLALPEKYRKRLRTTNSLERLNEEIRRRERVIRIFPNRASAVRLLGALLMEVDEKWASGRKYLDMAEYLQWRKDNEKSLSIVTRIG
jgi:transposase-like protein